MATEDVQVQFGAKVDELDKGVEHAKEKFDELVEGANQIKEVFAQIAEVAGIALSLDALKEFVVSMGELGEHTERAMAILGLSSKQIGELGFVARETGSSQDALSLALERFSRGLQQAQSDSGPVAKALEAMGMRAKDIIGLRFDEILAKVAEKFSGWEDGANKTAIAMSLFGRTGAEMIPTLDKGAAGIKDLGDAADATGSVLSEKTTKALVDMQHQLVATGASFTGLGATIASAMAPAITQLLKALQDAAQGFTYLITSGNLWNAALEELRYEVMLTVGAVMKLGTVAKDVFTLNWAAIGADWAAGTANLDAITEEHYRRLGTMLLKGRMQLQSDLEKAAGEGGGKTEAPALPYANKGATDAAIEAIKAQIEAADAAFAKEKDRLATEVKLHEITHTQETQSLLAALDVRVAAEKSAQEQIVATYPKGSAEYLKAQNELTKITEKGSLERQKIMEAEQLANVKDWTTALDAIKGAWDSQLKGLLDGTTTWSAAMKTIVQDLVIDIIKELEKIAIEKAALGLTGLAGGPAGLFGGLGALFGFQVGTDYVPKTGLALVHEGEAIIPAWQNPAAGGSGGGGAGGAVTNVNISISALDGASVQRIAPTIARQITQLMNNNPTLRPSY